MKKRKCIEKFLDEIGTMTFDETAPYKFSHDPKYGSKKYRKGIISVMQWVSDLSTYYLEHIQRVEKEFLEQIAVKKETLHTLKDGDFKNGIMSGFERVEEIIECVRKKRE